MSSLSPTNWPLRKVYRIYFLNIIGRIKASWMSKSPIKWRSSLKTNTFRSSRIRLACRFKLLMRRYQRFRRIIWWVIRHRDLMNYSINQMKATLIKIIEGEKRRDKRYLSLTRIVPILLVFNKINITILIWQQRFWGHSLSGTLQLHLLLQQRSPWLIIKSKLKKCKWQIEVLTSQLYH